MSVKNIQCTFQALKKVRNAKLDSIRDLFSSFNKEELNVKGYKRQVGFQKKKFLFKRVRKKI